jgi:ABC-type multidrug transport system permease subunit
VKLDAVRSPIVQLTRVRLCEFLREPEAVFWVFFFPILVAVALGVAFRSRPPEPLPVGVVDGAAASWRAALASSPGLRVAPLTLAEATRRLRAGKLALVVLPGDPPTLWFDPTRPESRLARLEVDAALARAAGRASAAAPPERVLTERGARYIDFLVPGLLGMNLMGTGMWSVGFSLVSQRVNRMLKLFVASPMRRWQFLAAQILARFVFLVLEVTVFLGFALVVLDVPLVGSALALALVALLGAFAFVGLGLLVAARPRTIEAVSGWMNVVMFPMWIGSGTFFSTERFPAALQPLLRALPLSALNEALRGVMLEGLGLAALAPQLALLLLWALGGFALALKLFRWQ